MGVLSGAQRKLLANGRIAGSPLLNIRLFFFELLNIRLFFFELCVLTAEPPALLSKTSAGSGGGPARSRPKL